jgi:2-polyprenyl-3-methyl-5-hydroxy-6-metoxy-1,4-benzoquinol methylase
VSINKIHQKILNVINYTKNSGAIYNGEGFESAYHSIEMDGKKYQGQRDNVWRLSKIPYDFKDKVVLDIGCNMGGVLKTLSNQIKEGVGLDYDYRCINAANLIKAKEKLNNINYYLFNLEKEDLGFIKNFFLKEKVDLCFLLSVCMWIKNWKEVILFCSKLSSNLIFETNGSHNQQCNQVEMLEKLYSSIQVIYAQSFDDQTQHTRTLLFCSNE